jgi:hypothetical protein
VGAVALVAAPRLGWALTSFKPTEIKKLTFIQKMNIIAGCLQHPCEQHADGSQGVCIGID